jgi:hypothetical protein
MPAEPRRGLTPRATLLLAALALVVAFVATLTMSADPAPKGTPAIHSAPRGPAVVLRLAAATVPKPRLAPKPRPPRRRARPVPPAATVATPQPTVAAPVRRETPQPEPRRVVPPRRYVPPPPVSTPRPTPVATPMPEPEGEFDTTGEEP